MWKALLIISSMGMVVPAYAQGQPYGDAKRQAREQRQEAKQQERAARRQEHAARPAGNGDGRLTREERQSLHDDMNRLSKDIYRERGDEK